MKEISRKVYVWHPINVLAKVDKTTFRGFKKCKYNKILHEKSFEFQKGFSQS